MLDFFTRLCFAVLFSERRGFALVQRFKISRDFYGKIGAMDLAEQAADASLRVDGDRFFGRVLGVYALGAKDDANAAGLASGIIHFDYVAGIFHFNSTPPFLTCFYGRSPHALCGSRICFRMSLGRVTALKPVYWQCGLVCFLKF